MGDVKSTTNLTAGYSGGPQESMAGFYDEVITRFSLALYHVPPTPAHALVLIILFPARSRSPLSKTV
jgi:hypothetical protein